MVELTSDNVTEGKTNPLRSKIGLWLGPLVFVFMLVFVDLDPANPTVTRMAAVILIMAIWWITEAIPLPATTPFSGQDFIKEEIDKLGAMSTEEKRVAIVFASVH